MGEFPSNETHDVWQSRSSFDFNGYWSTAAVGFGNVLLKLRMDLYMIGFINCIKDKTLFHYKCISLQD